jgi:hypothetical protein
LKTPFRTLLALLASTTLVAPTLALARDGARDAAPQREALADLVNPLMGTDLTMSCPTATPIRRLLCHGG